MYDEGRIQKANPADSNAVNIVSPGLITDGIIFMVDGGNSASYPGSNTPWYDISGNANTGILTNGANYSTDGNGSINFDGNNDYVDFSDSTSTIMLPTSGLTISAWFKTSTANRWLVDKSVGTIGSGYCLIGSGAGTLFFFVNSVSVNTSNTVTGGTWLNVVGTWTRSTQMVIYRNAVAEGSRTTSVPASINNPSYAMQIGTRSRTFREDFWNGQIAQVIFYNRALLADEVTQNFNATRPRFGV